MMIKLKIGDLVTDKYQPNSIGILIDVRISTYLDEPFAEVAWFSGPSKNLTTSQAISSLEKLNEK